MSVSGSESSVPEDASGTEPVASAEAPESAGPVESAGSAENTGSVKNTGWVKNAGWDDAAGRARASRLNQPWRGALAAVEVLVAALLAVAAPWVWQRGIVPIQLDGAASVGAVTRAIGSWLAIAIAMGTVAALLVINALRQLMLAVRGR